MSLRRATFVILGTLAVAGLATVTELHLRNKQTEQAGFEIQTQAINVKARLAAMRRPVTEPTTFEEEAKALAVGYVAALFARDCGFIARRTEFPAIMKYDVAQTPEQVIPADRCNADAEAADPMAVLAARGLKPVELKIEPYVRWATTAERIHRHALLDISIDRMLKSAVVTAVFASDSKDVKVAEVFIGGPMGNLKVIGYDG